MQQETVQILEFIEQCVPAIDNTIRTINHGVSHIAENPSILTVFPAAAYLGWTCTKWAINFSSWTYSLVSKRVVPGIRSAGSGAVQGVGAILSSGLRLIRGNRGELVREIQSLIAENTAFVIRNNDLTREVNWGQKVAISLTCEEGLWKVTSVRLGKEKPYEIEEQLTPRESRFLASLTNKAIKEHETVMANENLLLTLDEIKRLRGINS